MEREANLAKRIIKEEIVTAERKINNMAEQERAFWQIDVELSHYNYRVGD